MVGVVERKFGAMPALYLSSRMTQNTSTVASNGPWRQFLSPIAQGSRIHPNSVRDHPANQNRTK
jgi:hypothetical protein